MTITFERKPRSADAASYAPPLRLRRRSAIGIGIGAAASLGLAACGRKDKETSADGTPLTHVKFNLEWVNQAQFAGFYIADKKGYYKDEGLDVEVIPGGPGIALQILAAGSVDIAMYDYGSALTARQQGADLVTIAPVFERDGNVLVYFADRPELADPKNWAGKKVSLFNGFNASFDASAAKHGVSLKDIEISSQSFDMTNFVKQNVDMADATLYNEWAQAIAGAGGRKLAYFDYNKDGTAILDGVIVAKRSWLDQNPTVAEAFLRASMKGYIDARDDPSVGVDATFDVGSALPEKFQVWQMNEINKLNWPSTAGLFTIPDDVWTQNEDLLYKYGVIKDAAVHDEAVDMSYRDKAAASLAAKGVDLYGKNFKPMKIDPYTYFK